MSRKSHIYKTLKDYQAGKLDKYEAMAALELDSIYQLFALLTAHQFTGASPDAHQSENADIPLAEYFTHG